MRAKWLATVRRRGTMADAYNGWTNKATWLVKFWIDHDQGEQNFWLSQASAVSAGHQPHYCLALALEHYFEFQSSPPAEQGCNENDAPLDSNNVYTDLMTWALAMVDWDSIAKALIEDAAEVPA
jgi:hypothetical protein